MIHKIFNEIFEKTPASFSTSVSPEDGAKLLSKQTHRGFLSTGITGKVRVDRVVLRRSRIFWHNSFAPQYYGRFVYENGQTSLTGYFTLSPDVKIFMSIWFGFILFASMFFLYVGGMDLTFAGIISGIIFSLACLTFAAVGYALVKFSKRLANSDKEKIKAHIESCLNKITA